MKFGGLHDNAYCRQCRGFGGFLHERKKPKGEDIVREIIDLDNKCDEQHEHEIHQFRQKAPTP